MNDLPPDVPFDNVIREPLFTEEGLINPVAMAELESAIGNISPTFQRMADDSEWTEKRFTSRKEIVGAFAMWACRQSPYGCPTGLETVCKYLNECLKTECEWTGKEIPWANLGLCDINKMLHDILHNKGVKAFDAWNECVGGKAPNVSFTSRYGQGDAYDPDHDFIDLDALLHNVCITIRDERRRNDAFDKRFDEKMGKR
jgi:hypothetical protein